MANSGKTLATCCMIWPGKRKAGCWKDICNPTMCICWSPSRPSMQWLRWWGIWKARVPSTSRGPTSGSERTTVAWAFGHGAISFQLWVPMRPWFGRTFVTKSRKINVSSNSICSSSRPPKGGQRICWIDRFERFTICQATGFAGGHWLYNEVIHENQPHFIILTHCRFTNWLKIKSTKK